MQLEIDFPSERRRRHFWFIRPREDWKMCSFHRNSGKDYHFCMHCCSYFPFQCSKAYNKKLIIEFYV